ncbi:hypothetical protein I6A84_06285 [Frankia sp. CNm7]|uniref:Uncharacterized protein n=1 Tax=Frankia nepalensis TaxID=1836974 RepID=A0A937RJG4_9ACTN|nr:hypothetical protein [Frankia nepalensis]MBL7509568.1 hypothetical protein [Frankia nepalensis]MBL7517742.1 hypothetical protein [Frankia nepalensis]MBL7633393.1 hypothetical protein [Frankia nepalensis]
MARVALAVLVTLCWLPLVVILTARSTVLSADFYTDGLDDVHAYDRVYTEVLPDPAVDSLLAGLPVDRTLVTANLRAVLPPSTIEGLTDEQIGRIVDYLRGDADDVQLSVDMRPLFASISGLANRYLAGELGEGVTYQASSVSQFTDDLLGALDDMAAGRPPTSLPVMELSAQQVDIVLRAVLDRFDEPTRARLAEPARALLRQGDIAGALALLGPPLFQGDDQAIEQIRGSLVNGTVLDLGVSLSDLRDKPTIRAIDRLHDVSKQLPWIAAACGLAMAGGLVGVAALARRGGRSPVRAVGYAALAAGLTTFAFGVALRLALPNPLDALDSPGSKLPPGAAAVLTDFGDHAYRGIEGDFLWLSTWMTVVGLVLAGASLLVAASRRLERHARWRRLVATSVVVVPALVLVTWAAFPGAAADSRVVCQGSARLCDRHYDEVTHAASHNAMANSEDLFLGSAQDPSIVHQLDLGVRGLLLDVHHWTTPEQIAQAFKDLTPSTRAALEPLTRGALSARPGLWLCHNVCQLGALDFTGQLRTLDGWLDRNPTEVVTLILQDEVPAAEIEGAFAQAGLADELFTPPDDPDGDWPTLREMIDSGRRLVVFTERQDTPGGFLRSFYRYGSETPFDAQDPSDLAGCALGRGSVDAKLLLMNHWLTAAAPDRRAALAGNASQTVVGRAQVCERERRQPTFVAVDFVNIGDLPRAVDVLNGLAPSDGAARG